MKSITITNIHNELISLFVKRGGVEQQAHIPPGESIVVDTYETKTMRFFTKKQLIEIRPAQLLESDSFAWLDDAQERLDSAKTIDESVDSNHDEVMDDFHTTKTHEAIIVDEDVKHLQENLFKALAIPKEDSLTRLEIIEDEVEQYVEGGFIKGEWTEEDLAYLKKNYPSKGRKYCSTHLNRNESSVQKKINALGLKKKKKK